MAVGQRTVVVTKPDFESENAPMSTLSSTERPGKRATFWNVRAMPMRAMRCGGTANRSWPSKVTLPSVGS